MRLDPARLIVALACLLVASAAAAATVGPRRALIKGGAQTVAVTSCAQSTAFLARTAGLNAAHQNAYTTMICGLVTDGVWSTGDVFYIFATSTSASALLNLISASNPAVVNGAPTFTADSGYGNPGSVQANFINSYNPSTQATNFSQNSACVFAWTLNSGNLSNSNVYNNSSTSEITIWPRYTAGTMFATLNSADDGVGIAVADSKGFKGICRTASTTANLYDGGVNIGTHSLTSVAPASLNLLLIGGAGQNVYPSISVFWVGGKLTDPQSTALYNRVHAYMQTIAGVP